MSETEPNHPWFGWNLDGNRGDGKNCIKWTSLVPGSYRWRSCVQTTHPVAWRASLTSCCASFSWTYLPQTWMKMARGRWDWSTEYSLWHNRCLDTYETVEYLQLLSKFKVVQCNLQTDEISELPRSGWGGSSLIWSCSIKYILVKKHSWLKEPLFVDDCPLGKSWFSMLVKWIYTSPSVTGNLISNPARTKVWKINLSTKFHAFKLWICQY